MNGRLVPEHVQCALIGPPAQVLRRTGEQVLPLFHAVDDVIEGGQTRDVVVVEVKDEARAEVQADVWDALALAAR